jgi:hypothetical protein
MCYNSCPHFAPYSERCTKPENVQCIDDSELDENGNFIENDNEPDYDELIDEREYQRDIND